MISTQFTQRAHRTSSNRSLWKDLERRGSGAGKATTKVPRLHLWTLRLSARGFTGDDSGESGKRILKVLLHAHTQVGLTFTWT